MGVNTRNSFKAMSGVRQGCPVSSSTFIIATDCMLRFIKAKLSSDCLLRAFADDLAIVSRNIWRDLPNIYEASRVIEEGCNLKLNLGKCKVIPAWNLEPDEWRDLVPLGCMDCQHMQMVKPAKIHWFHAWP